MKRLPWFLSLFFLILQVAAQEEQPFLILNKHSAPVKCVSWSPDGKILATGSEDKTIILWDAQTGEQKAVLEGGHLRAVMSIAFSPNGKKLVTGGDKTLVIWTSDGQREKVLGTTTVDIWSISISDDGKYVAAGSFDKKVQVYNLIDNTRLNPLDVNQKSTLSVCFTHQPSVLLTGSLDETVKQVNVDSSEVIRTYAGHSGNIYSIAMASHSGYFVSASKDNTIKLWNLDKDKSIRTFSGAHPVMSVSLAMDGKWMLSGSIDNTVTLRETANGNKIYSYIGFEGGINQVAFSPDGQYFAVASGENKCRIYKVNPDLFVDFYFEKEVAAEIASSPLFAPKGSDETRQDYKTRQDKAAEALRAIYDRYYKKYLDILAAEKFE